VTRPLPRLGAAATLLLAAAGTAGAQPSRADPSDVQGWYQVGVDLDLPKKWKSGVEYRLRTEDNASAYRGSYVTGELGRTVRKGITLFGNYRFADVDAEITHRLGLGGEASRKVRGTTLSFRPQVQHRLQGSDDEQGSDAKTLVRTRLQLKRPLTKRFEVYASTEPYFNFDADYPVDNWRNTAGVEWEYLSGKTVDLFYIYRPDYAKSYNRTFHVVGMNLGFDVKVPGGKKAKAAKAEGAK
jgi:hypothetical protein